jgi:hypothetical protein
MGVSTWQDVKDVKELHIGVTPQQQHQHNTTTPTQHNNITTTTQQSECHKGHGYLKKICSSYFVEEERERRI